jgi:hypothetical protein
MQQQGANEMKMRFKCTVIDVDATTTVFEYADPPALSLLKEWVGGFIESVPYFDTYGDKLCVVFCNEEGKLMNLAKNPKATFLWAAALMPHMPQDILHGNIVIITAEDPADLGEL